MSAGSGNSAEQSHVEDDEGDENFYGAESGTGAGHGSSPPAAQHSLPLGEVRHSE